MTTMIFINFSLYSSLICCQSLILRQSLCIKLSNGVREYGSFRKERAHHSTGDIVTVLKKRSKRRWEFDS